MKIKLLLIFLFLLYGVLMAGSFEKGNSYHGFKLIEKKFVNEVNADCYLFEHEKSGARLLKIANDDANKSFSVAFKTVPNNDCGTPHIMEHSVLNGSKNFPVKSPFDILTKGSLNTFINAFTGADMTMYPVASMNDKDFFNLMNVYLDAVYFPLIYDDPRILKQEGWHYEMESMDDPVTIKGVVYNEMKGAFSSPTRELYYQMGKILFPDNGYSKSSGGYPESIPDLTYEDFLDFHRTYYHPSNSRIFLYGDGNLEKELEFINGKYLSAFERSNVKAEFPLQKPFDKMKMGHGYYSVTEGSDTKGQTYLALAYVFGEGADRALNMELDVLTDALVNQESAPVRLALMEAGIGKDVSAYVSSDKQNLVQITVKNADLEDKDEFLEIVKNTIKETLEKGLDREALEGIVNRKEFRLREGDNSMKGLTYNFAVLTTWMFADDPFPGLEYEKPLAQMKKDIKSGRIEELAREVFIDNNFSLLYVLEPKPGLEKELSEKTAKKLEEYKNSLSQEEKEQLVKETKELIEYQKREDSPEAVATIPMLSLEDIDPKAMWYEVEKKELDDIELLHYDTYTNNVVYNKLFFDARVLPEELLPYASLLSDVLGSLDTKNYSYADLDKQLNIHTGGFYTYFNSILANDDDSDIRTTFTVDSKSMEDKTGKMIELVGEILNNTVYDNPERLEEVLTRLHSQLESRVKQDGLGYATTRLMSYISRSGRIDELTRGIEYYRFVSGITENFEEKKEEVIANLEKTAGLLFTRNNLIAGVTADEKGLAIYKEAASGLLASLPEKEMEIQEWKLDNNYKNEGFLTASKVQYVLKGFDYKKLGYEWNGKMRVLQQILSRDWLQNQVRVIGGAYGGWSRFSPTGVAYFASYRDPNLGGTLKNYDATPGYLENFDADENEMTRFIIGTIASMDRPLSPSQQGSSAMMHYFRNITREKDQKERDEVLSTTPEDIRKMAGLIKAIMDKDTYCVYGSEEKLQSEKELFTDLQKLTP